MINKNFKDNWLKILRFNTNREILEDPENVKEYFRIPLTPISINANLLYQFFELLYPKFINDQQHILDIILMDDDKKNMVQNLYLYETRKAGIHETVKSLPPNIIKIKSLEPENLDELFDKAQKAIIKEFNIQISSIRLFRKETIELVNNYCERIEEISVYEFLEHFLDLIQKLINQDLVYIYPEPIIIKFLRSSLVLLDKIQLQNLFKIIEEIIPEFDLSLLINASDVKIIIHLQKQLSKFKKSHLAIRFLTPPELNLNLNNLDIKENLNLIRRILKTEKVYYVNQNDIISFISDFFELAVPLKKENLLFLLQRALFGFRSFENHWDMVPRPKIYNTLIRFIIRLFGFNINLKKLSHWSIPYIIFNFIDFHFGLNSKILFIITDQEKSKIGRVSRNNIFKNLCNHIFLLKFEESSLKKIYTINKDELFSDKYELLYSIKEKVTKKYGYISAVIIFDKFLLQNIIKYFFFSDSKFLFLPWFKILKMFKNEKFFRIYPEFPFYKLIKKKRTITILKLLLPLLIDKHEF